MNKFNLKGLFVLSFLLIFAFNVHSQNQNSIETASPVQSVQSVQSTQTPSRGFDISQDPSTIQLGNNSGNLNPRTQETPSTAWLLIKMIFALAVVAGIAYLVIRMLKKNMKTANDNDPFLRKVSSIALGQGKSVQIVTIQENAYVLGVTDSNITLLGTLDDKQLINAMNVYNDRNENVTKPRSFAEVLDMFMAPIRGNKTSNVYGNAAENVAQSLKKQSERLNQEDNQ
ncbi:MAG: flagellar biosynthetic protein FliO [Treponema sp.]|nr:flagellar biosynthetic protein FliO [Treponema sp.]